MKKITKVKEKKLIKNPLDPRRKMVVKYLVAGFSIPEICAKMNIKKKRCRYWLKNPLVQKYFQEELDRVVKLDSKERKRKYGFIMNELFKSLVDKIDNESFDKMNAKSIMKFMLDFGREIKAETPEDNITRTSGRVDVVIIDQLSKRYKMANSSSYDDRDKVIDIELPKENFDEKKLLLAHQNNKREVVDVDSEQSEEIIEG